MSLRASAALLALIGLLGWAAPLRAAELTGQEVVLLQPDAELRARVPSVDAYGDYINAQRAGWFELLQATKLPQPTAGFVVLAVRPGQQARLWLDFDPPLPPALAQSLQDRSRRLMPPVVRGGPVLLALKLSLDGAAWPAKAAPEPAAWRQAAALMGQAVDVADLVQLIWDRPSP